MLPFFLHTPKIEAPRACGALRGIWSKVWETSVLLPPPIRGTLFSLPFLPASPPVPRPLSSLPVSCCIPAFCSLYFYHPSRLCCLVTPPASPFSKQPLHPFPSGPTTPLPPALQTDEPKLSGFTSFEPGLLFFFPVLQTKSCETLSAGPCNLFRGLPVLCPGMQWGGKGRHCPLLFPRLSPKAGSPRLTP